jgi:hypothetical protein
MRRMKRVPGIIRAQILLQRMEREDGGLDGAQDVPWIIS